MKTKTPDPYTAPSGGLRLGSLAIAGLVAASALSLLSKRGARGSMRSPLLESPKKPAPLPVSGVAQGRRASVDTYSVAGEEDPGASVDAPSPPPTTSSNT